MNALTINLQALHARAAAEHRREQDSIAGARARDLALIRETVEQDWPRCGGERIDGAEVWHHQWADAKVIAWLEAGVYTAAAAVRLASAGVEQREVGGEYEVNVTLGLAFARGNVDLDQVLRLRRQPREVG